MNKLRFRDAKLKSPGKQAERTIIDTFGDVGSFAKEIGMQEQSVRQYLKEIKLGSEAFKFKLCKALNKDLDEIVKSDREQIKDMVQSIYDNIKEYKNEEDIRVLERINRLCIENNLDFEILKMQRNFAMVYFYGNQIKKAIGFMESFINSVKIPSYLVRWKSELGLMYFYCHEYKKSEELFEEVDSLLEINNEIDKKTIYLHYYRYGILKNNTSRYLLAEKLFKRSLKYATTNIDIGDAIVNVGISFEKQKKYNKALEHYNKALNVFKDDLSRSAVFNNLAEVYKLIKEYDKALYYIKLAFNCVGDKDLERLFVYYQTYAEVLINKGEVGEAIKELMQLLNRAEDRFVHKKFIIQGINVIMDYGWKTRDIKILEDMEKLIYKSIKNVTLDNNEYIEKLKDCLGDVRAYIENIENSIYEEKGGN